MTDLSAPDPELLFVEIGRAVVFFQSLENALWQFGVLAAGHSDYDQSRRQMTGHTFNDLSRKVERAVNQALDSVDRDTVDYRLRLNEALAEVAEVRRERNRLVHSTYLFLEGGGELQAILRSDVSRSRDGAGVEFDQEHVVPGSFDEFTRRVASALVELNFLRTQLGHWLPLDH